jgi:glycosyltransferase involved in cell wall biosynthesis
MEATTMLTQGSFHIALLSPEWPPGHYANGVVTYVALLRQALLRRGHRVTVFTPSLHPDAQRDGVELVRAGLWYRLSKCLGRHGGSSARSVFESGVLLAQQLARVHRRQPIDVIEMEETFGFAAAVKRELAVPLVLKLHGPAFLDLIGDAQHSAYGKERIEREGRALAMADAVISPSARTLEATLRFYGLTPAISEHVVNPAESPGAEAMWSLEHCEPRTLLFIGRFDERKGGDLVLQAFRLLLESHPEARLVFAGPDAGLTDPDGKKVGIEAYCNTLFPLALRDHVTYLGRVPPERTLTLRTQALATIVASRWDNQPYTVLEAMLQACPVIATDAGGTGELIVDGVTGRLVASEDVQALAMAMRSMIEDPQAARELGLHARRSALSAHAPELVADQTLAVYRRAMDRARTLQRAA